MGVRLVQAGLGLIRPTKRLTEKERCVGNSLLVRRSFLPLLCSGSATASCVEALESFDQAARTREEGKRMEVMLAAETHR
ncbi:MAG TPA: hypothetical protein VG097_20305 [Gemmata sp.]|nr:hypothetical protein [Gemmata sp.]